jgi:hypothetical protein
MSSASVSGKPLGMSARNDAMGASSRRTLSARLICPVRLDLFDGRAPAGRRRRGWRRIILAWMCAMTSSMVNCPDSGNLRLEDDLQEQVAKLFLEALEARRGQSLRRLVGFF